MSKKPIITLLTDFGLKDTYVAEMKAVILSICPNVTLVDLTHNIEPYNIRMGAYLLARSAEHFPKGTIHLAVVDPGVGSSRKPLIIEANSAFFVGPDNGLLVLAAEKFGINHVYEITNRLYIRKNVSNVFHGRDVFAPVAAHLALGVPAKEFGKEVFNYVKPAYTKPKIFKNKIIGEIIHIDHFGNVITNITRKQLKMKGVDYGKSFSIIFKNRKQVKVKLLESYSKAKEGELLTVVGSGGFIEVSANMANASKILDVKPGIKVTFNFSS